MREKKEFSVTKPLSPESKKREKVKPDYKLSRQITPNVNMFYYKSTCQKKYTHITKGKGQNHVFVVVLGDSCSFKYRSGKTYYPKKYDLIFSNRMKEEILEFNESYFHENLSFCISSKTIRMLANKKGFKNYSSFLTIGNQLYIKRANLKIIKKARRICDEISEDMKVVGHIFLLIELIIKQYLVLL